MRLNRDVEEELGLFDGIFFHTFPMNEEEFVEYVRGQGITVGTGRFRTHMNVELTNDGPVTIWIDTENL